ncbi:MAG TPA: ATP-binding protein [Thermoproteota archaeon]|nr:ATP-binding protein [Thermoproteota archaeon]
MLEGDMNRKNVSDLPNGSGVKLETLFEIAMEGITVVDKDENLTYANRAFSDILGYETRELIGRNLRDFVDEEGFSLIQQQAQGRRRGEPSRYEIALRRKNGGLRVVQVSANPLWTEEGHYAGALAVVMDITMRKQQEAELHRHSQQLEELVGEKTRKLMDAERLAATGEVVASVGHDLSSPIQVMMDEVFLMKAKMKSLTPEGQRAASTLGFAEFLQSIDESSQYMSRVVADLQDSMRPVKVQAVETDIRSLLDETLATVLIPKNVIITKQIANDLGTAKLFADRNLMKRAFTNLVTNAFQAMPKGGRLSIRASKKGETLVVSFSDTGVGISKENLIKLFRDRFTTRDQGHGLGLAICKRVVEAHGGDISVESETGKGTTVTVEIPLKKRLGE